MTDFVEINHKTKKQKYMSNNLDKCIIYSTDHKTEKYKMMKEFAKLFSEIHKIKFSFDDNLRTIELGEQEIKIHCDSKYKRENNESMTFYDVIRRTYTKKHNLLEKKFMKFILSYKARFTPE